MDFKLKLKRSQQLEMALFLQRQHEKKVETEMDETKKLGPKEFNLNKKLLKSLHVIDDDQKSI